MNRSSGKQYVRAPAVSKQRAPRAEHVARARALVREEAREAAPARTVELFGRAVLPRLRVVSAQSAASVTAFTGAPPRRRRAR
jgi:hypothetical protein